MIIDIYAEAIATNKDGERIKGVALKKFNGIGSDVNFTDYISEADIPFKKVLGPGYMFFKYKDSQGRGKLVVHTEYVVSQFLEPEEAKKLVDYTQGQWADGVGEGFEQREVNSDGDFISPWYPGQKILYQMKP